MRKIIAILCAAAMASALTGCTPMDTDPSRPGGSSGSLYDDGEYDIREDGSYRADGDGGVARSGRDVARRAQEDMGRIWDDARQGAEDLGRDVREGVRWSAGE